MGLAERVYRASKYKGGYLRHLPSCDWIYLSTFATLKDFASIRLPFLLLLSFIQIYKSGSW